MEIEAKLLAIIADAVAFYRRLAAEDGESYANGSIESE
jgi:hypothetical protein